MLPKWTHYRANVLEKNMHCLMKFLTWMFSNLILLIFSNSNLFFKLIHVILIVCTWCMWIIILPSLVWLCLFGWYNLSVTYPYGINFGKYLSFSFNGHASSPLLVSKCLSVNCDINLPLNRSHINYSPFEHLIILPMSTGWLVITMWSCFFFPCDFFLFGFFVVLSSFWWDHIP